MSEWQDISTAPKDVRIRLWPHDQIGQWDWGAENWILFCVPLNEDKTIQADWGAKWRLWYEVMADCGGVEPTHWQAIDDGPPDAATP